MTGATDVQGVVAHSQRGFPVNLTNNTYDNMAIGVNAQQSNVVSTSGTYTNLGAGIFMGSDGINSLQQSGGTFTGVRTGIEGRNINITSFGNTMTVGRGYRLYNGKGRSFNIHDNDITANDFGVLMFNWRSMGSPSIKDNIPISIDNPNSPDAAGIRLAGLADGVRKRVEGNELDISDAFRGIDLDDCIFIIADDNEVQRLDGEDQKWDGIGVRGGHINFLNCNNVGGSSTSGSQKGILLYETGFVRPTCNTTSTTDVGMHFLGVTTHSRVRGNLFSGLDKGLEVGYNDGSLANVLGTQPFHGNQWTGIGSDGLVHWGGSFAAQLSQFIVNSSETPGDWSTSAFPQVFIDDLDDEDNLKCSETGAGCDLPPNPDDLGDFTDDDCWVVNGSLIPPVFPNAQLWTARRQLFRGLMELDDITAEEDCLETFYNASVNTPVGQFEQVRKDMMELFQSGSTTQQDVDQYQQDWNSLSGQLVSVMDQLPTATTAQDSASLVSQMDSLQLELFMLDTANTGLAQQYRTEWLANAQSILTANAAITADSVWAQNQKDYNEVWLEMVINEQEAPDSAQTVTLNSIANQCPFAGGEAVYQARSLLGEGTLYNDEALCGIGAQSLRKPPFKELAFDIYPNPADVFFTIDLKVVPATDGEAILTDLMGRIVLKQNFKKNTDQVYIFTEGIHSGLYQLTVKVGGEKSTQNISIVNR